MVALKSNYFNKMDNKSAFHSYINGNLDACVNLHEDLIDKIRFRERIKTSLNDLLATCDDFTLEAYHEGKNMEDLRNRLKGEIDKFRGVPS